MYRLEVYFNTNAKVTLEVDNLVELAAIIRGMEISNREVNCLDHVVLSGGKTYSFIRENDRE